MRIATRASAAAVPFSCSWRSPGSLIVTFCDTGCGSVAIQIDARRQRFVTAGFGKCPRPERRIDVTLCGLLRSLRKKRVCTRRSRSAYRLRIG